MSFLTKLLNRVRAPLTNTLTTMNPVITKTDNTYNEVNPLQMMRTIIDDDPRSEDIFKYISYRAKSKLPDQTEQYENKITLFISLDEILLYSYIPDENLGLFDMPKFREYDYRLEP
jgi:hypothetical protein